MSRLPRRLRLVLATGSAALAPLLVLTAATRAEDPPSVRTLKRSEDPVVVLGARLPRIKGVHKDLVRLYSVANGKWKPIPFQVDERTPQLNYCWTAGPDPVKDVDEGIVDDDDELVFMARDAGDRMPRDLDAPPGARVRQEIELVDPKTGERGWTYAFAFPDPEHPPPPGASTRYASVAVDGRAGALFRGETFEIACPASAGQTGRPTHVRLRSPDGSLSPEILSDAARAHLHASYLFVHVDREDAEARASLGSSYIDGPVRVVAPIAVEVYLVWGKWITAVRSEVFVYRSLWEQRLRFAVPMNFDPAEESSASVGVEAATGFEAFAFRNDRNERPVALSRTAAGHLDAALPAWNVVIAPEGAVISGLRLDPRLASPRHGLLFEPPRIGFRIDLTGLKKADEASPYSVDYWLAFAPGYRPGDELRFVELSEAPLQQNVR
jgi:hypothetical protein